MMVMAMVWRSKSIATKERRINLRKPKRNLLFYVVRLLNSILRRESVLMILISFMQGQN